MKPVCGHVSSKTNQRCIGPGPAVEDLDQLNTVCDVLLFCPVSLLEICNSLISLLILVLKDLDSGPGLRFYISDVSSAQVDLVAAGKQINKGVKGAPVCDR